MNDKILFMHFIKFSKIFRNIKLSSVFPNNLHEIIRHDTTQRISTQEKKKRKRT